MNKKILLIGGMPRSGTTLISNLIQREYGIPVSPETHFFDIAAKKNFPPIIDNLPAPVLKDQPIMDAYEKVKNYSGKCKINCFEELLSNYFGESLKYIAEKTPAHILSFDYILRSKQNYNAIIIVRNCSEVCDSLRRMSWNKSSFLKNIKRWVVYYRLSKKLVEKYSERIVLIRYEDLCSNPADVLKKIEKEIDIFKTNQNIDKFNNYNIKFEPWKKNSDRPPEICKKEKWALNAFEKGIAQIVEKLTIIIYGKL